MAGVARPALHPWFPGHMLKAARELKERLRACDAVVEVRDARAPLSAASDLLRASGLAGTAEASAAARRKHIVALNKADLADPRLAKRAEAAVAEDERRRGNAAFAGVVHTSCAPPPPGGTRRGGAAAAAVDASPLLGAVREALADARRPARPGDPHILILCGLPNVGKSALIASLRRAAGVATRLNGGKARVGAKPGVTRAVSGFELCGGDAPLWCLDSPGVTAPQLRDSERHAMALALVHCVPEAAVGGAEAMLGYALTHVLPHAAPPRHVGRRGAAADGKDKRLSMNDARVRHAADAGIRAGRDALADGEDAASAALLAVDAATVEMLGGRRTDEVEQDAVHGAVAKLLAALRDGKLGLVQLDRDLV